jgi:hypothetical protein
MSHIILTNEQMQTIRQSTGPVEIRSPDGRTVARVPPRWTPEEIAAAKRAAATGVCYPSDQVQKYAKLLEDEVTRTGHVDEARARELLQQIKPVE